MYVCIYILLHLVGEKKPLPSPGLFYVIYPRNPNQDVNLFAVAKCSGASSFFFELPINLIYFFILNSFDVESNTNFKK